MEPLPLDPNDIEALKRRIAELEAAQRAGVIETQGGAVVDGPIDAGGHFIGRDFIQHVTQVIHSSEDPEEAQSVVATYLQALVDDLAGLNLGEIDVAAKDPRREPLQLADVYVPLGTTLNIPDNDTLAQWHAAKSRREREETNQRGGTRPVLALEALATHRALTLLGKPGSGKSTFGAYVMLVLAQAWQGHGSELAKLGEHWTHGSLLPIRVVLRRFAEQLPSGDKPACAGDLWAFIARDLKDRSHGLGDEPGKYLQRIARKSGALMLLDGLDECGSNATRQRVLAAINEIQRSTGAKCRFLLTARPYAFPGGPDPAQDIYALADLDDDQIEQFIRAWYATLVTRRWLSPGDAERKLADLLDARQRPDLLPLARNPLLLTLMATLHANRGRLPDDRADLYNESVDLLMLRWNRQIGADKALLDELGDPSLKLSDLREVLEQLAFEVHAESVAVDAKADPSSDGTADIGEDRLVRAFRPLLKDSRDKAAVVVEYIEKRAGLLIGQGERKGERQFAFPHRTFQEFLAACHLAAQEDFAARCRGLAREAVGHWQVVLPLAARIAKAERGATAADELIGGKPNADLRKERAPIEEDWTCALLAGMQLQEIGMGSINKGERTRAIAARVADWLAASLPVHPDERGAPAIQRADAGDVLAALGDPRFDPQRFHLPADDLLGFVPIAADPNFRIGTRETDRQRVAEIIGTDVGDDEINDAPTPTPEFYIARYPITAAQFRAFVEATQFQAGDVRALHGPDSRPVCRVNWHEAQTYCEWLNEALDNSSRFDGNAIARLVREEGWRVSLPSELEWEKAARGGLVDAVFSWGDTPDPECANYSDSEINDASAVGCFPADGYGLYDMIGNVWEWTRSRYGSYPYRAEDGREEPKTVSDARLVVRGGSWFSYRVSARCAFRGGYRPDSRHYDIGFRVVLRSAHVLPSLLLVPEGMTTVCSSGAMP